MSSLFWVDKSFLAADVGFFSTLLVNSCLIYLVSNHTKNVFGTYKYLIISFSFMGIIFATAEFIIKPMTHNYNVSFTFFSVTRPFGCSKEIAKVLLAGYSSTYASTISLLAVHFIYRYWTIFDLKKMKYFKKKKIFFWILLSLFFGVDWSSSVYFLGMADGYSDEYLSQEIKDHYSLNITELAYFAAVVYDNKMTVRWRSVGVMLSVSKVVAIQYAIMIYCGTQMHRKMGEKLEQFSATNRRIQKQLFKTLVVQITVPTFTIFLPVMGMFVIPFFNSNISMPTGTILCALSLYPPMDGLIVMCIVSDYRNAALGYLKLAIHIISCNRIVFKVGLQKESSSSGSWSTRQSKLNPIRGPGTGTNEAWL